MITRKTYMQIGNDSYGCLKEYALQNTLIIGNLSPSINNVMNTIIGSLMYNYTPDDVSLQLITGRKDSNIWISKDRYLPHFYCQPELKDATGIFTPDDIKVALTNCLRFIMDSKEVVTAKRQNVIIIDFTSDIARWNDLCELVYLLAKATVNDEYNHVILIAKNNKFTTERAIKYFTLRLAGKLDERMSDLVLGCNIAATENDSSNGFWIYETSNPDIRQRLSVLYKPTSYFNKLCKAMSYKYMPYPDFYGGCWRSWLCSNEEQKRENLMQAACDWNVTPVDSRNSYWDYIKGLDESDLCSQIFNGIDEYAIFDVDK